MDFSHSGVQKSKQIQDPQLNDITASTSIVVSHYDSVIPDKDSTAGHDLKNMVLSPAKVISSRHSAVQGLAEPQILTDLTSYRPVTLMQDMFAQIPGHNNDPLYRVPTSCALTVLTDSMARKHLNHISLDLQIAPTLTFHMFRKVGTTWALNHGVPLQDIMLHGTWSSQAIWKYVNSTLKCK